MKKINKLAKKNKATYIVTVTIVNSFREIIDEKQELYLDEIAGELAERRDFVSLSTISLVLKDRVGHSLQVCCESYIQLNDFRRILRSL